MRDWIETRTFQWPIRERVETPPGARDVWIRRADRPTLHGWYMAPSGEARRVPAVLHVHGNAGHVGHHAEMSAFLARAGFGVLVFDYRGFGQSERGRGMRGALLEDAESALDTLIDMDEVDGNRVGVYGVSLGGVIGLALAAARGEVRCVVSLSAFATWKGVARDHAGALGAMFVRSGLDATTSASKLAGRRLMIVHGTADEIVPFRHAGLIEAAARGAGVDVERLHVDGAGHNDVYLEAQPGISHFYEGCLGRLDV